jgi:signal transduction histidine kinase
MPSPSTGEDYAITHPLRPLARASALTLCLFILVCVLIYLVAKDRSGLRAFGVMACVSVFITLWLAATMIMVMRRPSPKERVILWRWIANGIVLGSHAAAVGVIWLVMPDASTAAQLMIAGLVLTCLPTGIIASPESITANRSGVITMLGSLTAFLATRASRVEHVAAIYVVVFGAVMFVLAGILNKTVGDTVAARLASDAAARKLDLMLGEVAAQRDAKTKFIAAASHDLGQPLQAVALFFDQSLRTPPGPLRGAAIDGVGRGRAASVQRRLARALEAYRGRVRAGDPGGRSDAAGQRPRPCAAA